MIWFPKRPTTLESAGVKPHFIRDQVLKGLYTRGVMRGMLVAETLHLPFLLIDDELRHLRENDLIVPVGGSGIGGYEGMDFSLTERGREIASSLVKHSPYFGPAPVSIHDYFESVQKQKFNARWVKRNHLDTAFSDIVINKDYLNKLGPALNSGGPIFLYGKPGNGKTTIAERLARIFRQGIFVPHVIEVDGQVIQFFDEKIHRAIPLESLPEAHPVRTDPLAIDSRWVYVYRPFVIVGGELTLQMLDLILPENQRCYEAPFQLKANCGVLLVDDFGRQIVQPKEFLNRWIYPLEKGVDFLTLVTGKKIEVPFEQILIFSTNLDPGDLGDEAFWRRIKYKIAIPNPTEKEFKEIFFGACRHVPIPCSEDIFKHLVDKYYKGPQREFRAVHPRDILSRVRDHISYNNLEMKLTKEIIDLVCAPYFESLENLPSKSSAKAA